MIAKHPDTQPHKILLVEDDWNDARLIEQMLNASEVRNKTYTVRDGEHALAFLLKGPIFAETPTPDLILLDLNIPKINGFEFLDELASFPALAQIPVAILTGSTSPDDKARCIKKGVAAYLLKPDTVEGYDSVRKEIETLLLTSTRH